MKILITAGPTREHFDPVRFISNASSGRMGYMLASEAQNRGHEVVLVSGPVGLKPPQNVKCIPVVSADEMLAACKAEFESCAVAICTAAVADWKPARRLEQKLPKTSVKWAVDLEPTPDICAALGAAKGDRLVVGFAVQDEEPHARAEAKMTAKRCDIIVLNDPSVIGREDTCIEVFTTAHGWRNPIKGSKKKAAAELLSLIESRAKW